MQTIRSILIVIILFTLFSALQAQREEPTTIDNQHSSDDEKPSSVKTFRQYDSYRYFKERRWDTGSGSAMALNQNIEEAIRKVEERIRRQEEQVRITPIKVNLAFHILCTDDVRQAQEDIQFQLEALNRDFNNKAISDAEVLTDVDRELMANSEITFQLAEAAENGIVTVRHTERDWKEWDDMKNPERGGSPPLHPTTTINIWVCNLPPGRHSYASSIYCIDEGDGIVIDSKYFGKPKDKESQYDQGKTLTHLIANYLGLIDLTGMDYCGEDGVKDTPIHNSGVWLPPEGNFVSTCPQTGNKAMPHNLLANAPDRYMYMFTKGQVLRLHSILSEDMPRHHLIKK